MSERKVSNAQLRELAAEAIIDVLENTDFCDVADSAMEHLELGATPIFDWTEDDRQFLMDRLFDLFGAFEIYAKGFAQVKHAD